MALLRIEPYIIDSVSNFVFNTATVTSNLSSGNANLGNLATANYFSGSGNNLSNIQASNISGVVANANVANVAYSVSGANVSGEVSYAAIANAVSAANVDGLGNIATINIDGNSSNILYGNGVFASAPVTYGDSNVATYLPNYTGDLSPGNITIAPANLKLSGGNANYVLKTDGAGNLSWTAQTGGGGGGGGASVTVSTTAPSTPSEGDLWLDSETGELNVYFSDAWASVTESAPQLTSVVNSFTGDSLTTTFTLTTTPASKDYTFLAIGGILQPKSTYTITGNVLTTSSAVPSNTPIELTVLGGYANSIGLASYVTSPSQANITSLGTLTTLTVSGDTSLANVSAGNITVTANATVGNLKTDHLLYANGAAYVFTTNAAGSNTQVQFNNSNSFAGSANLTFNTTTNTLSTTNLVTTSANLGAIANVTITGGSNGQAILTDGAGNLSFGQAGISSARAMGYNLVFGG